MERKRGIKAKRIDRWLMVLGKSLYNQILYISYFLHMKTPNLPDDKLMLLFDTCCHSRQFHRVDILIFLWIYI